MVHTELVLIRKCSSQLLLGGGDSPPNAPQISQKCNKIFQEGFWENLGTAAREQTDASFIPGLRCVGVAAPRCSLQTEQTGGTSESGALKPVKTIAVVT